MNGIIYRKVVGQERQCLKLTILWLLWHRSTFGINIVDDYHPMFYSETVNLHVP